jgi:hypothetical protein
LLPLFFLPRCGTLSAKLTRGLPDKQLVITFAGIFTMSGVGTDAPFSYPTHLIPIRQDVTREPNSPEWALSQTRHRLAKPPEGWDTEAWLQKYQREVADLRLTHDIETNNLHTFHEIEGYWLPNIYNTLFYQTKAFTATVEDLVAAICKLGLPSSSVRAAEAACLIADFSIKVLRSKKSFFHRFLNSQRCGIYWILDDALLRICLELWEDKRAGPSWDKVIRPVNFALASAQEQLHEWAKLDVVVFKETQRLSYDIPPPDTFTRGYFERTLAFLPESIRVYEIWRTVRLSGIRRLPNELANFIIADIFEFEKLPVGDLRSLYLSKGKGKA